MNPTRRTVIRTAGAALLTPAFSALAGRPTAAAAGAEEKTWRHGLSLFGEVRYPPGFQHFDYVNPNAPKGGTVRLAVVGTFDNFNPVVYLVKGNLAAGIAPLYDSPLFNTLTAVAYDEAAAEYALIAEAMSHPPDLTSVSYRLRAEAKWHDGAPLTVDDVIFSFEAFKQNSALIASYYRHVVKAEKSGEREVTFFFDGPGNRELPQIMGQLVILPKHWWEGSDRSGNKRDVTATTLEPLLGSGNYRIKDFAPGQFVVYERVKDYWGGNLNVKIGQDNFDELRYDYFRDTTVALEAFKADQADWRAENSAKNWATAYDFPAARDKRVVREEFPLRNEGLMQGFAFNLRRDKFQDARLRRALNFAFDFEEMNKQFFYGYYHRVSSYFDGTELAWNWRPEPDPGSGALAIASAPSMLPQGAERDILETVRDKVPPEVFTAAYSNPVGGNPERVRANLREATRLLKEAGYEVRDLKLVNVRTGEPLSVEFLIDDPNLERLVLFYKTSLERLGVAVSVRSVDDAQYQSRLRQWDYDIVASAWGESLSPGNEQRDFWGSQAADTPGSRNYVGIKNPAVDALIDRVIFAKHREELIAATRALDRVLLWNHYVVPNWTLGRTWTARWDRFGRPDVLPKYELPAFPTIWWWDAERAAKVGMR